MKLSRYACCIALAFMAICFSAQSQQRHDISHDFFHPTAQGSNIDWCLYWGENNCGKRAADQFCSMNGFAYAVDFDIRYMKPTLLLGDNRRCDDGSCQGFTRIRCEGHPSAPPPVAERPRDREDAHSAFFPVPLIGRTRVDRCLHWGTQCGKPAADQFCQQQGFFGAADFSSVLARPTLIQGENQVCDRSDCTALENVHCVGGGREAPRRDWDRNGPPPERDSRTFPSPTVQGYAVDRCLYMGRECDQPAADQFCSMQGFRRAINFAITPLSPTLVLSENKVCKFSCHAFSQITCSNR
ncbi:MAG: hypothetical protein P4L03_01975 [Terracidiphilus sp.]|nr:hypothetical protein [Terracidiphilus sp.]